jgi:hypothetical protein
MSERHPRNEPWYRRKQTEDHARQQDNDQKARLRDALLSIHNGLDHLAAEQVINRTQLDTRESHKQRRDWATFGALVATALAAIGTIITSLIIGGQQHSDTLAALAKTDDVISETRRLTDQTRRAADIAQQTLVVSRRPWLDIADTFNIKEPLTITKNGIVEITLTVAAKNTGESPALSVYLDADILLDVPGVFNTLEIMNRDLGYVCDRTGYGIKMGIPGTNIIMPHDTKDLDAVQTRSRMDSKQEHRVNPVIAACVSYSDEFSGSFSIGQMFWYYAENNKPIMNTSIGVIPGKLVPITSKVVK